MFLNKNARHDVKTKNKGGQNDVIKKNKGDQNDVMTKNKDGRHDVIVRKKKSDHDIIARNFGGPHDLTQEMLDKMAEIEEAEVNWEDKSQILFLNLDASSRQLELVKLGVHLFLSSASLGVWGFCGGDRLWLTKNTLSFFQPLLDGMQLQVTRLPSSPSPRLAAAFALSLNSGKLDAQLNDEIDFIFLTENREDVKAAVGDFKRTVRVVQNLEALDIDGVKQRQKGQILSFTELPMPTTVGMAWHCGDKQGAPRCSDFGPSRRIQSSSI